MKISFNKTIILISAVLISLFLVSLVALAALKIETQLDMANNKIVNLATPSINSDAATLGSVLAAGGGVDWSALSPKFTYAQNFGSDAINLITINGSGYLLASKMTSPVSGGAYLYLDGVALVSISSGDSFLDIAEIPFLHRFNSQIRVYYPSYGAKYSRKAYISYVLD